MDEKDRFDSLMRIAEFNIKQFNERREYSWKISIGFWGAIIGSIAVLSPFRNNISPLVSIPFGLLIILIHIYWLYGVFCADQKDKNLAFKARDDAMKIVKIKPPELETNKKFLQDWSARFQGSVTILLVIITTGILVLLK